MRIIYYLCLISILVSGCGSTSELTSIEDAQSKIGDHKAIIHLKTGQEYKGRDIKVSNDSIQFFDMATENILQFSKHNIKYIKVYNSIVGMGEGILIGGITSGALVYIFCLSLSDPDKPGWSVSDEAKTNLTLIGAGIGGIIGLGIGSISGHRYKYIFPEDSIKNEMRTSTNNTNSSNQQILKCAP